MEIWGELWEIVNLGEPGGTRLGEPLRANHVAPPLITEKETFKATLSKGTIRIDKQHTYEYEYINGKIYTSVRRPSSVVVVHLQI